MTYISCFCDVIVREVTGDAIRWQEKNDDVKYGEEEGRAVGGEQRRHVGSGFDF